MKKLSILLGTLALGVGVAGAQAITSPTITTVPAFYTLDEEVKWVFDFGNAPDVSPGDALYMWTWNPSEPGVPIPLKEEGNKVWSLTLIPTELYKMTPEAIMNNGESNFWFNIRLNPEATRETGTLSIPKVDYKADFIKGDKVMDYYPKNFRLDGTLTIVFNANKVDGFLPAPSTVHMHSGMNAWTHQQPFNVWEPETRAKTEFRDMGDGIYAKHLVPLAYFPGVTEETIMENIDFVMVKYNGNAADPQWAGTAPDMRIVAPGLPVPPPAAFSLFPLKVSVDDILVITRTNNDRGQRLTYTLVGGAKTVTAPMDGAMTQQRAFVNLQQFRAENVKSLRLTVKDQNDRTIYEGDVPLATFDKPVK